MTPPTDTGRGSFRRCGCWQNLDAFNLDAFEETKQFFRTAILMVIKSITHYLLGCPFTLCRSRPRFCSTVMDIVRGEHRDLYRWVQRFAPEMEKRLRWQWRWPRSRSWRIDETYVRVRGQWAYLYRALDKFGNTIDFYLSATRNTKAAKRFLGKALNGWKDWELPEVLNTDKAPTYAGAPSSRYAASTLGLIEMNPRTTKCASCLSSPFR